METPYIPRLVSSFQFICVTAVWGCTLGSYLDRQRSQFLATEIGRLRIVPQPLRSSRRLDPQPFTAVSELLVRIQVGAAAIFPTFQRWPYRTDFWAFFFVSAKWSPVEAASTVEATFLPYHTTGTAKRCT